MTGKIYLIRNLVNGKGYVGQTTIGIDKRFAKHSENARSGIELALYRAMRKHGIENFNVIEVATCGRELLDDLEKHYIKFYGTSSANGHGYNMTDGGDSARRPKGSSNSEESKTKNSAAHKGMKRPPRSEDYRAKQSAAQSGKQLSEETKSKIAAKLKGQKKPPRSEEYKANMAAAKKGQGKGKPWSDARRMAHKGVA
jgi:group I intron endonuclease